MNKSILIITDAPTAPLFAPRMRYLITNLSQDGWQCTIAAERMPNTNFTFPNCRHIKLNYYDEKKTLKNRLLWLADKLFNYKETQLTRLLKHKLKSQSFDLILCSTFNTFPLTTAKHLAKLWNLPLVIDFRDLNEQWGTTSFWQHNIPAPLAKTYNHRSVKRRNRAIRSAVALTTISPWHLHFLQSLHPHVELIYNGFDHHTHFPKDLPCNTFNIVYTGKIYDFALRNPIMLFEALYKLKTNGTLPTELIVDFYCENNIHPRLRQLAEQYNISQIVNIHPFVSNDEVINLLHQSSICLLLTQKHTFKGPHGIMTTKFFEALGVEKPVLCIPNDEHCLSQVISRTNAGLAATSTQEITAFILDKYNEWKINRYTRQKVNTTQKQLFSRQYQAKQFEQLFLSLINQ